MVSVTYTDLQALINNTKITQTHCETILDTAIDTINLYANQSLNNISGGTVTLTSSQRGAVLQLAAAIYYYFYEGQIGASSGGMAFNPATVMDNPFIMKLLVTVRNQLSTRTIVRT